MEKWDAYDQNGLKTGDILIRGEVIPDGLYHLVCEVLVQHTDGDYLLMKRSSAKPNHPGEYEATAGGSALMGEDKLQCVRRELFEETGIICVDFTELGLEISDKNQCIFYNFICTVNCDKSAITLQEGETEGFKWLSEADFIKFVNSGEMIPSQKRRYGRFLREMGYII